MFLVDLIGEALGFLVFLFFVLLLLLLGYHALLLFSKEKLIPLPILLPSIRIILRRVEIVPHAHGIDMFVLLIPSPINDA